MASIITAKLHGVEQLRGTMTGLAKAMTPAVNKAMEKVTKDIAALSRQLVRVRTGRLKRSIRAREVEPLRWQVIAGNRRAFYAHFIERGTIRSRAYPFLKPAFDAYRKKVKERLSKAVMTGLRAGARKRTRGK